MPTKHDKTLHFSGWIHRSTYANHARDCCYITIIIVLAGCRNYPDIRIAHDSWTNQPGHWVREFASHLWFCASIDKDSSNFHGTLYFQAALKWNCREIDALKHERTPRVCVCIYIYITSSTGARQGRKFPSWEKLLRETLAPIGCGTGRSPA